jgi:putative membrane protein
MMGVVVVAQMMDRGDMNGGGHWWGWLIALGVLAVIVGLVVWVVTRITATNRAATSPTEPARRSADDILADRFARGEIDEDEYRRRRDALRE